MKRWGKQQPSRFDQKELNTDLGEGNFIFIGSSCDLFAADIPSAWILETLDKAGLCKNEYLVQSKNPSRFLLYHTMLPPEKFVLCTTIETNSYIPEIMGKSPSPEDRSNWMSRLNEYRRMVTIEPIIDFDLKDFSYLVMTCQPYQVNIGADSGNNKLPEPSAGKIKRLIEYLSRYTTVIQKPNLARLLKE
jgi:hypothetical protein